MTQAEADRDNLLQLFNTIEDLIFILDGQGNMLKVNDAVIKKLGYSEKELIGKSVLFVHPKDRRDEAMQIVQGMLAGTQKVCPVPLETKAGQKMPVETRVVKGFWNNKDALFGITKDLSDLKASEEKFAKVFDNNSCLMALSSLETSKFLEVNSTFLEALGYKKEDVIGKTSLDLGLFADPAQRTEALDKIRKDGRLHNYEVKVKKQDDNILIGLFSAVIIQLQDQQILLTVMTDITEAVNTREMLKKRTQDLEEINTFMVGRELQMIELKKRIEELEKELATKA